MDSEGVVQGRKIGVTEIEFIRQLIAENPTFTRYRLSRTLCDLWNWRDPQGQLKDMAARTLLVKMAERGWIELPARRRASPNRMRHKRVVRVDHASDPITDSIAELIPLQVRELSQHPEGLPLFEWLLHQYHYLSPLASGH